MFIESQNADPAVNALCIKIASRCFSIIRAIVPEEDRGLALKEFYRVCREALDKPPTTPEL
jgi:hypothetical protein